MITALRWLAPRVALQVAALLAGVALGLALLPSTSVKYVTPAEVPAPPPDPAIALLAERPDCGGDHPGVIPTSAIIRRADGTLHESRNIDRTLNVALGYESARWSVVAFCYPKES